MDEKEIPMSLRFFLGVIKHGCKSESDYENAKAMVLDVYRLGYEEGRQAEILKGLAESLQEEE